MQYLSVLLAAGLMGAASAAPAWTECPTGTSFYSCYKNGFKGCSSFDPCNLDTAPAPAAAEALAPTTSTATPYATPASQGWVDCPAGTSFYKCFKNGFNGCSSFDPCNLDTAPAPVQPRAWVDCPAGSSYYKCFKNGFVGCLNYDPCDLATAPVPIPVTSTSSYSSSTATPIPTLTTSGAPTVPTKDIGASPPIPGRRRQFNPIMHYVFPDQPTASSTNTSFLWLSQDAAGKNKRDQVMIFPAVPSTAKECSLGYTVPLLQRNFAFAESATIDIIQLDLKGKKTLTETIGSKDVSFEKVKGLKLEKSAMGSDTTNWPQSDSPQAHAAGSSLTCGGEMPFYITLQQEVAGATIIGQKEGYGFYVEYDC